MSDTDSNRKTDELEHLYLSQNQPETDDSKRLLDEYTRRFTQELLDKISTAKAQEKQKPLPAPPVNKSPQPKLPEPSPSIPEKPKREPEPTRDQSDVLGKIVKFIAIGWVTVSFFTFFRSLYLLQQELEKSGSSVCVMQWTGVIRDVILI